MKGSKNFDNTLRTNLSVIQIQGNQRGVMRSRCLKQQAGPSQQEKEYTLRKMMLSSYGRSAGKTSQVVSHSVERRQNDLSELEMRTFSNNTILLYGIDCLEEKRIENYFSPIRVSVQLYDHSHYSVLFQSTEVMITALYKALPSHQTYSYQKLKENCLQNDKFQAEWRQLKPLFDRKLWFRILNNWDYMNRQNQSDFHKKPVHQKSQRNVIPYDQSEDKSQNIDSSNQLNKPPRKRRGRGRNSQNSKNSNDSRSNSKNNSRQRSNQSNKSNKSRSRSRQQRNDHPVKNHCQQSNCKGNCYQFITQLKQLLSHHCTAHSSRSVDRNQRNNSRRQQSQKFQQKKQFYYNRYNNPTGQSQKKQNMMTTRDRSLLEDKERTDSAFEDHSSIHEQMQMLSDDEEQNQVFKLVNQMKNYVIFEQSQESNQIQEQPLFNLQNSYIQNQENTRFLS